MDIPFFAEKNIRFSFGLCLAVTCLLLFPSTVFSNEEEEEYYEFNLDFLRGSNQNTEQFKQFSNPSYTLPGIYAVDFYINKKFITSTNLEIKEKSATQTSPCLTPAMLGYASFNLTRIPEPLTALLESDALPECIAIEEYIDDATIEFDSNLSTINLSIPQIYIKNNSDFNVPPELWDKGITALTMSYMLSGYQRHYNNTDNYSLYGSFNTGFNIAGWYFKQNGTMNLNNDGELNYNSLYAYVQRDIPRYQGRVTLGQTNTSGQLFNTTPITGIQFQSDDRMLPESLRGYAPEIRGMARSTARVMVYQNDRLIYSLTVPPGEFLIDNLYPSGYSGSLEVVVEESDGSSHRFSVPYASLPELLRPNTSKYSLTFGYYRNDSITFDPLLLEGTYQRGINNYFTWYGGGQINNDYMAAQAGIAIGSPIGAFSLASTHTSANIQDDHTSWLTGQSLELKYTKNIIESKSFFSLSSTYFTPDYYSFNTTMQRKQSLLSNDNWEREQIKNLLYFSLNQDFDEYGSVYASISHANYWQSNILPSQQYQLGYNSQYKNIHYGIRISRSYDETGRGSNNFQLNFSFPLSIGPNLNVSLYTNERGENTQQVNLSDIFGDNNEYSYYLSTNRDDQNNISTSAGLSYTSPYSLLNANITHNNQSGYATSLNARGSMVIHKDGITFNPYTGDTYALIEAKGATGAYIRNQNNIRIDGNGYALLTNLNPYQMNEINIDPHGTDINIELLETNRSVAPHANAVSHVTFKTRNEDMLFIESHWQDQPIPFGIAVYDEQQNIVGYAGQGGQIFVRITQLEGRLSLQIDKEHSCYIRYALTEEDKKEGVYYTQASCDE